MRTTDLSGQLLVATPEIDEGVFFRSVILVLHHDDEGAQGIILNRPLDAEIDAILPGWGRLAAGAPVVYHGGPVQFDTALGVVAMPARSGDGEGLRRLFGSVGLVDLDSDPSAVSALVHGVRIYAGYAGWSAGQLESEIEGGSWFVVPREAQDVFAPESGALWHDVLARQAGPLALVATFPKDPSLN